MKSTKSSIASAFVPLVFLAVLRIAGANLIMTTVPAPYGAGMVSALGVLAVIAVAVVVDRLVRYFYWDGHLRRKRRRETPALIEDIFTIALLVLGASIGLFFEAGVSFTGLLAASGATAIVLGIALQAVINDVFSGLSVNFDGSYTIGDWLTVYSDQFPEPLYGRVQGITWRTTFLALADGRRVMVPNHLMTSNPVMNHSRPAGPKRMFVEVPVANYFPVERAMSILLGEAYRVVRGKPFAQKFEPEILINRLDANATYFHVRFYADPDEVNPENARSIMAIALQRAALRHKVPSPVDQVELVPAYDNSDSKLTAAREALGHVAIFKDVLDAQQLDALVAACNVRPLPSNTAFIRQGEPGTSMFVIVEGAARVTVSVADGEARVLAVLAGGDIVGEMSLMTGAPRAATVTSLTFVRVLEVTKESMETLLKATPGLLERFGHVLAARQLGLSEIASTTDHKQSVEPDVLARMRVFFSRAFR
jgi:small-conductance mechanosensitive channel/CRP-like cAMP-binding protein